MAQVGNLWAFPFRENTEKLHVVAAAEALMLLSRDATEGSHNAMPCQYKYLLPS